MDQNKMIKCDLNTIKERIIATNEVLTFLDRKEICLKLMRNKYKAGVLKLQALKAENDEYQKQCKLLEQENLNLKAKYQTLEQTHNNDINVAQLRYQSSFKQLEDYEKKISNLEKKNNELQKKIEKHESKGKAPALVQKLKHDLEAKNAELQKLKQDLQSNIELKDSIQKYKDQIENNEGIIEELTHRFNLLETESNLKLKYLAQLQFECNELKKSQSKTILLEKAQLTKQIEQLQRELKIAVDRINFEKITHNNTVKVITEKYEIEIHALKTKLNELNQNKKTFDDENSIDNIDVILKEMTWCPDLVKPCSPSTTISADENHAAVTTIIVDERISDESEWWDESKSDEISTSGRFQISNCSKRLRYIKRFRKSSNRRHRNVWSNEKLTRAMKNIRLRVKAIENKPPNETSCNVPNEIHSFETSTEEMTNSRSTKKKHRRNSDSSGNERINKKMKRSKRKITSETGTTTKSESELSRRKEPEHSSELESIASPAMNEDSTRAKSVSDDDSGIDTFSIKNTLSPFSIIDDDNLNKNPVQSEEAAAMQTEENSPLNKDKKMPKSLEYFEGFYTKNLSLVFDGNLSEFHESTRNQKHTSQMEQTVQENIIYKSLRTRNVRYSDSSDSSSRCRRNSSKCYSSDDGTYFGNKLTLNRSPKRRLRKGKLDERSTKKHLDTTDDEVFDGNKSSITSETKPSKRQTRKDKYEESLNSTSSPPHPRRRSSKTRKLPNTYENITATTDDESDFVPKRKSSKTRSNQISEKISPKHSSNIDADTDTENDLDDLDLLTRRRLSKLSKTEDTPKSTISPEKGQMILDKYLVKNKSTHFEQDPPCTPNRKSTTTDQDTKNKPEHSFTPNRKSSRTRKDTTTTDADTKKKSTTEDSSTSNRKSSRTRKDTTTTDEDTKKKSTTEEDSSTSNRKSSRIRKDTTTTDEDTKMKSSTEDSSTSNRKSSRTRKDTTTTDEDTKKKPSKSTSTTEEDSSTSNRKCSRTRKDTTTTDEDTKKKSTTEDSSISNRKSSRVRKDTTTTDEDTKKKPSKSLNESTKNEDSIITELKSSRNHHKESENQTSSSNEEYNKTSRRKSLKSHPDDQIPLAENIIEDSSAPKSKILITNVQKCSKSQTPKDSSIIEQISSITREEKNEEQIYSIEESTSKRKTSKLRKADHQILTESILSEPKSISTDEERSSRAPITCDDSNLSSKRKTSKDQILIEKSFPEKISTDTVENLIQSKRNGSKSRLENIEEKSIGKNEETKSVSSQQSSALFEETFKNNEMITKSKSYDFSNCSPHNKDYNFHFEPNLNMNSKSLLVQNVVQNQEGQKEEFWTDPKLILVEFGKTTTESTNLSNILENCDDDANGVHFNEITNEIPFLDERILEEIHSTVPENRRKRKLLPINNKNSYKQLKFDLLFGSDLDSVVSDQESMILSPKRIPKSKSMEKLCKSTVQENGGIVSENHYENVRKPKQRIAHSQNTNLIEDNNSLEVQDFMTQLFEESQILDNPNKTPENLIHRFNMPIQTDHLELSSKNLNTKTSTKVSNLKLNTRKVVDSKLNNNNATSELYKASLKQKICKAHFNRTSKGVLNPKQSIDTLETIEKSKLSTNNREKNVSNSKETLKTVSTHQDLNSPKLIQQTEIHSKLSDIARTYKKPIINTTPKSIDITSETTIQTLFIPGYLQPIIKKIEENSKHDEKTLFKIKNPVIKKCKNNHKLKRENIKNLLLKEPLEEGELVEFKCNKNEKTALLERQIIKIITDIKTGQQIDEERYETLVVDKLQINRVLYIVKYIVQEMLQHQSKTIPELFFSDVPMTIEQNLFRLLIKLEEKHPYIMEQFLQHIERSLIQSQNDCTKRLSLTRIYLAVCRMKNDLIQIRKFLVDIACKTGKIIIPILHLTVSIWSIVIAKASDIKDPFLDVTKVFVRIVSMPNNALQYPTQAKDLRNLFQVLYGFDMNESTLDQLMDSVFKSYSENSQDVFCSAAVYILARHSHKLLVFKWLKLHFIPLVHLHIKDVNQRLLVSRTLDMMNGVLSKIVTQDKKRFAYFHTWLTKILRYDSLSIQVRSAAITCLNTLNNTVDKKRHLVISSKKRKRKNKKKEKCVHSFVI